jgi:DNA-binding GntR family transcriptional regulator
VHEVLPISKLSHKAPNDQTFIPEVKKTAPPLLLFHINTRTGESTKEMAQSRLVLLELTKSAESMNEYRLSKLTSIDRHSVRTYCRKLQEFGLLDSQLDQSSKHVQRVYSVTADGKMYALTIALEEGKLSEGVRRRVIHDVVFSLKGTDEIYNLAEKFLHALLKRGEYSILLQFISHTTTFIRTSSVSNFWELTWLSFLTELDDEKLGVALEVLEDLHDSLNEKQAELLEMLSGHFIPIPLERIRRAQGIPSLEVLYRLHPELQGQFDRLPKGPRYVSPGDVAWIHIEPGLIKNKRVKLRVDSLGYGMYRIRRQNKT